MACKYYVLTSMEKSIKNQNQKVNIFYMKEIEPFKKNARGQVVLETSLVYSLQNIYTDGLNKKSE